MMAYPIRKKEDLLRIVFEISSYLLIEDKPIDRHLGEFVVKIDKMSRVFITFKENMEENKHFSFLYPFFLSTSLEEESVSIFSSGNRIPIDNRALSLLKSIVATGWFSDDGEISSGCLLDHYEMLERSIMELGIVESGYIEDIWLVIKDLLLMDFGYLRYDYDPDPDRLHENMHPLYHLDINYDTGTTFKIGLNTKCVQADFIDMLDTKTNCRFLS